MALQLDVHGLAASNCYIHRFTVIRCYGYIGRNSTNTSITLKKREVNAMKKVRGFLVLLVLAVVILSVFTLWKNGQGNEGGGVSKDDFIRQKTEDWTPHAP
jgi:hypothetical protein